MEEDKLNERIKKQIEEIFQEIKVNQAQIPFQAMEILETLGNSGYDWIKRQGPFFRNEIKAAMIALIVMDRVPKEKIEERSLGWILARVYTELKKNNKEGRR